MNKLALLIRRGIIKTKAQREQEQEEKNKKKNYDVWEVREEAHKSKSQIAREKMQYPAPKLPLPGHAERYQDDICILILFGYGIVFLKDHFDVT